MELQLGLALPSHSSGMLDLNRCLLKPIDAVELDILSHHDGPCFVSKKRCYCQAFELSGDFPRTLSLLDWNNHPNDDDDDPKDINPSHSFPTNYRKEGEGNGLVGWPPIKSWRKKICKKNQGGRRQNNYRTVENGFGGFGYGRRGLNSMYVKVKMEGVAIARKVDLSQHHSFETLTNTLFNMFVSWEWENSNKYKLTYQDREGDWLLAEDVPWRIFVRTVQRMKLLKSSNA